MKQNFDTIGIFAKKDDARVDQTLFKLTGNLLKRGKKVLIDDSHNAASHGIASCPQDELASSIDLGIVVGGDGTLLDAGRSVAPGGTPLLGINIGRLGFTVDILPDEMDATLDDVFAGNYTAEKRLMLVTRLKSDGIRTSRPDSLAVNDCVVRNQAFARVIDFETYMNDHFISHHRADGMIVATPTGSTAYALSSGGPVLYPVMDALALVPICPHTLSDRPLIVDAEHEIEIRISDSFAGNALCTTDGQISRTLAAGDSVVISRAPYDLCLIHPASYDYFNILRNKLHWGRDQQAQKL